MPKQPWRLHPERTITHELGESYEASSQPFSISRASSKSSGQVNSAVKAQVWFLKASKVLVSYRRACGKSSAQDGACCEITLQLVFR